MKLEVLGAYGGQSEDCRLTCLLVDDRIAVIFSPYDISCALENHSSMDCTGYIREDAARLGINVILFALQQ